MKYNTLYNYLLMIFVAALGFTNSLHAQSKSRKKKEPKIDWATDLWYGGGINLGFSSDYYNGLQSSYFVFGISPMAGYKINSFLSAGPRLSLDWTVAKFNDGVKTYKFNSLDYGLGIFGRLKFLDNFFIHLEYSQLNETYTTGFVVNGELEKERRWRDIALAGLGYNSNTIWAYEIYICYDFLEEEESFRLPIVYRGGITYNF